jgi:hypothetical protein
MGDFAHVIDPHWHGVYVHQRNLTAHIIQRLRVKPVGFDINTVGHSASLMRCSIVPEIST